MRIQYRLQGNCCESCFPFNFFFYCRIIIPCLGVMLLGLGCKKAVEVDPPANQLVRTDVYNGNVTAVAVLTGVYEQMIANGNGFSSGLGSISLLTGLNSDELKNYFPSNTTLAQAYTNSLLSSNTPFWKELYQYIYIVNAAIDGINTSNGLTAPVKKQLMGEAKFLRAFYYFYLVNIFGDVPLIVSTAYQVNATAYRTPKLQVYQQIISDLRDAQSLLADGYVKNDGNSLYVAGAEERIRPCKSAATALLARTYLYTGNWVGADSASSAVIGNTTYYSLPPLNNVFLKNSKEAIWQLQPVNPGFNTYDAYYFVLSGTPNSAHPAGLATSLIDAFEPNDARFSKWVGVYSSSGTNYYYPFKYKVAANGQPLTEYVMVLRLAEQYLIRAEARAEQNNLSGAASDLNVIRNRAGLADTNAVTQADLSKAIYHERQVELFTEWGHRWLDMKRTSTVDSIMSAVAPQKGSTWNTNWQLYPIPLTDLQADPNLTQNANY